MGLHSSCKRWIASKMRRCFSRKKSAGSSSQRPAKPAPSRKMAPSVQRSISRLHGSPFSSGSAGGAPPADPLENGLPCNLDIERWTLGAILRDGAGFAGLCELEPADFFLEKHRRIFDAIHRLHEECKPINYATVYGQLELQHWEGGELRWSDGPY